MNLSKANELNLVTKKNEIQELRKIIVGYNHVIRTMISRAKNEDIELETQLCYICPCDCDDDPSDECVYRMLGSMNTQLLDNQSYLEQEVRRTATTRGRRSS